MNYLHIQMAVLFISALIALAGLLVLLFSPEEQEPGENVLDAEYRPAEVPASPPDDKSWYWGAGWRPWGNLQGGASIGGDAGPSAQRGGVEEGAEVALLRRPRQEGAHQEEIPEQAAGVSPEPPFPLVLASQ